MKVDRYADAGAFLDAAEPWLAMAEIENSVMLTIASSIADGTRTLTEPPYFATARDGNQIDCCASRTPPHNLLVTNGTPRGLATLAADAFGAIGPLPGVNGPGPATAAFVEAWLALGGGRATISMQQRLHKIERINADLPAVQGRLREVTPGERDLAVTWALAFMREAIPNQPNEAEESVDRNVRAGTLYFWDDGGPGHDVRQRWRRPDRDPDQLGLHATRLAPTRLRDGRSIGPDEATAGRRQPILLPLHRSRKPHLEQRLPANRLSAGVRLRPVHVREV